ncbi:MAG TPA: hypothetical protein VGE76_14310 [Opitutaceae bacterium]
MRTYEVILHPRAWSALAATRAAEQKKILTWLNALKISNSWMRPAARMKSPCSANGSQLSGPITP